MNDYASVADLYDAYVIDTGDHVFWRRLAADATGPILELTAGTGRATVALRGGSRQPVVALDLVPSMLERLAVRFAGAVPGVWAVGADMTRLPFPPETFHLVVVPFNSLGELTAADERVAALREMRRVLAPPGRAVVTLHDPGRRLETLEGGVQRLGPFALARGCLEVLVLGRRLAADLAESQQTYRLLAASGEIVEERRLTLRFALPDASSLIKAASEAGLEVQAFFGDYDFSPYVPGRSPFMLAVLGRTHGQARDAEEASRNTGAGV